MSGAGPILPCGQEWRTTTGAPGPKKRRTSYLPGVSLVYPKGIFLLGRIMNDSRVAECLPMKRFLVLGLGACLTLVAGAWRSSEAAPQEAPPPERPAAQAPDQPPA